MNRIRNSLAATLTIAALVGCSSDPPSAAIAGQDSAAKKPSSSSEARPTQEIDTAPGLPVERSERKLAQSESTAPHTRTSFYRANSGPAKMPAVKFSNREQALSKVKVGDAMPAIELPKVGDGGKAKLAGLLGKKATVVIFWKGDRRMAGEQLADVAVDVVEPFGKSGVAVIGVAVNESAASASEALTKAGAKFTNLLDADGKAFAQVGADRLPRTYVLDPAGKIVWFDIEYSHATRRELRDALRALTEK